MSPLQLFVILAGLTNRLFIAHRDLHDYLAWTIGDMGLVFVYWETKRPALITLRFVNTGIQVVALIARRRAKRYSEADPA